MAWDAHLLGLLYTVLTGLVMVAFFLGRLTSKVDRLKEDGQRSDSAIQRIFDKLDHLAGTELARLSALEASVREHHAQHLRVHGESD